MTYLALGTLAILLLSSCASAQGEPICLHPDNPHYFLFRGEPTVLITSGEHYGAVLNLDFDYSKYLQTLSRDGMNNTRLFVGSYCEPDGAFNIARNTLAPAAGRFICPWARSDTPGYANGGNKFDLSRWDQAYFHRLRDFCAQASDANVVVEVNLFCPFYGDEQWALSPMNAANNVNGIGAVDKEAAYSLDRSGGLLQVQEEMTRRVVAELSDLDNVYFEIMNEPYIKGVPEAWQRHIADVIAATEEGMEHRHLISQNIANGSAVVQDAHPAVSILNFHYAWPPRAVELNYGLNRAIGDNETGFRGTGDAHYRKEGWAFIVAGGALYNNLDYSFTVAHEDGTFGYPASQPGGGGPELRRQLGILRDFIHGFDFLRMAPGGAVVEADLPEGVLLQCLAEPGRQYAVYLCRESDEPQATSCTLQIDLPAGRYEVGWLDPVSGETPEERTLQHEGKRLSLTSPEFTQDLALRLMRRP
jgi:hypothetical protein